MLAVVSSPQFHMLRETTAVKINLTGAFIIVMSPDRDLEDKVRKTWDEMACGYSRFISDEFSYVKMVEMPAIMELLGDMNGKLVLDLGCGSGEYALALARKGAKVTGLDISQKCLDLVQEKAKRITLTSSWSRLHIGPEFLKTGNLTWYSLRRRCIM